MSYVVRRLHATIYVIEGDSNQQDNAVADEVVALFSPSGTGNDYVWVESVYRVDTLDFNEVTEEYDVPVTTTWLTYDEATNQHAVSTVRTYTPEPTVREEVPANFGPLSNPVPEGWPDR